MSSGATEMKEFKSILVAVDRDNTEGRVLAATRTLGAQFGSEVTLIHVMEFESEYKALAEEKTFHAAVMSWLQGLSEELVHDGPKVCRVACKKGNALQQIIAASEDLDADLIVLGARGAASPHPFLLGTLTEKVIRRAAKPVLVVHPERPLSFGNIMCPVDLSSASARALAHAIRLARAFHGKLHIMTVLPLPPAEQRLDLQEIQWSAEAERAALPKYAEQFQKFLSEFDLQGVEWDQRIARGDPAQEIVAAALVGRASLLVMATLGRTGMPHIFLGSVALKVMRQMPCSLLALTQEEGALDRLQQNIDEINAACREGQNLLAQGFSQEALNYFDRCLHLNPYFAPAYDGKAAAHQHLKHAEQAERCRQQAELLRRDLGLSQD
jgi:nucleotide-binding universal stress UspA family protein